jgi:asparagine synthase (glutamine-hydrolysing)
MTARAARHVAAPAPPFRIGLREEHGWRVLSAGSKRLWLKGSLDGDSPDRLARRVAALPGLLDEAAARRLLESMRGHFALVIDDGAVTLAAVDRIRSIPLVHGRRGEAAVIDQDGGRIERALELEAADVDADAALAIALAGFTIGDDTLYRGVRQLGPGQFVLVDSEGGARFGRYHRFDPYRPQAQNRAALKRRLSELIVAALERVIAAAAGRPIAVPLSAGLDSRLIASGLKRLGCRDLLTFAYGLSGNHEAETSRGVAERLGLPWRFVPFGIKAMRTVFASEDYRAYRTSADSLTGVHFPQDYLALVELKRSGYLPPDAVIVNGQSGDFITGNHVPPALAPPRPDLSVEERQRRVIDALIAKHFKQWRSLLTPENRSRIAARLAREIESIGGMPEDAAGDHGVYEWCEFVDRQSKYVVNGQRLYEYLGHDWRLPLWDDAWLEFWARAPLEAKLRQNLYRDLLMEADWGGVWRDIPVNAKTVRPGWLAPLRLGLKALHAPLGRARWHDFERRCLEYWMGNLCAHANRRYLTVINDGRGHQSAVAFHIEDYLGGKGLALDGQPSPRCPHGRAPP